MSTGKRLAKRSIIGTRVSARGKDGKYYNGYIHALKSPASVTAKDNLNISTDTMYSVRFDRAPGEKPPNSKTEFTARDLIAPGFESIDSATFVNGQKVYLTYNGREIQAEVTHHRKDLDEVDVMIAPNGQEGTVVLTKRIDDLRLSESRKSPRLADQDTDFARLADMGSDRKRASTHSIDVPLVPGSRKRRPSSNYDSERPYGSSGGTNGVVGSGGVGGSWPETMRAPCGCGRAGCPRNERGDCMDECTAALVLMSLSCSPHSPYNPLPAANYGSWGNNSVVTPSPGVTSGSSNENSSSSDASWRTGTPSPNLSEEGAPSTVTILQQPAYHPPHNKPTSPYTAKGSPEQASSGTWDEGIERDYADEHMRPRKKTKKISDIRTKVKRECVENRNPEAIYASLNRAQSNSPKEIRVVYTLSPNVKDPMLQASTPVTLQRATPMGQLSPSTGPRSPLAGQGPPLAGQRPVQRSSSIVQRSSPTAQRTSPIVQRSSPSGQRLTPAIQRPVSIDNNNTENPNVASGYHFEGKKSPVKPQPNLFQCTWRSCTVVKATDEEIEEHVRRMHLEPQKLMELAQGITKTVVFGEEEFYYQEVEAKSMSSPPTMSHRDMARPPHEDPEYQRQLQKLQQLRLEAIPPTMTIENHNQSIHGNVNNNVENVPRSASVIHENYSGNTFVTFGVTTSPQQMQQQSTTVKHIKLAPGQSLVRKKKTAGLIVKTMGKMACVARRIRGDTKKCRKTYGMEKREIWCTQCRWKKACSRYAAPKQDK